jgi:predicted regulator of Ras-like GTPase activity (Roadblock/LC7/MglB family)
VGQPVHQSGLSADLDSFDLLDLVQVIQMARRDIALAVRGAGAQRLGVLRFAQGELLWAEFGALRGEEAFIALAAQHSGSIEELPWEGPGERNVSQPLSRLVMQAVEYRDAHDNRQPQRAPEPETRSRPLQSANLTPPFEALDHFNGAAGSASLGGSLSESEAMEQQEDDAVPPWVRQIHAASERAISHPTGTTPPDAPASSVSHPRPSVHSAQTEPLLSPPSAQAQSPFSSLLQEEMAVEIPEPTVPLSTPNGKFTLPALSNGNRPAFQLANQLANGEKEDPPTVPLPSVPGGLRNYATRREPPQEPPQESAPGGKLEINALPEQAVTMRAAPAAAAPSSPPQAPLPPPPAPVEPLPPPMPAAPATPTSEPKMSSISILEQLAYGRSGTNSRAEVALPETSESAPAAAPQTPASMPSALGTLATPASTLPGTETTRQLEQALETFAEQVGASCIATAVIRVDGKLLAAYKVRRGQDQDLASPAYHMANVMQSSLRALLMGGWGDLEDTFITGSTHSVMLRRLGRPEKGLFHVAVLERSGNPGLCRVRMRNSEAALLQTF